MAFVNEIEASDPQKSQNDSILFSEKSTAKKTYSLPKKLRPSKEISTAYFTLQVLSGFGMGAFSAAYKAKIVSHCLMGRIEESSPLQRR